MEKYNYNLEILNSIIALVYIPKNLFHQYLVYLLKDVILDEEGIFYSLTVNEDEISLFIDQEKIKIKEGMIIDPNYKIIRIYDNSDGLGNVGIVSKLSSLMSKNNIPILYVNSYNNNYILIKENYFIKALKCLKDNGFEI
jgi:hypothetical protein